MSQLYVLFEHATGYALFRTTEFEEISVFLPQVQASIHDVSKFRSIVNLVSFQPFKTGRDALDNINSISEGLLHPYLELFLQMNVPKSKKKRQPVVLGVLDPKLGALISETLSITCSHTGVVPEVTRGIRLHFCNLVKGFKDAQSAHKAQLGLGHHYSRAKVKFNVNKIDNMIIQSISIIDQLDKDINTFSMRIREWYSYHFPELIKVVPENPLYVRCVLTIKDRKNMPEDIEQQLEEILEDSTKVQHILEVGRSSMGVDLIALDMENIIQVSERVISLMERRKQLVDYLKLKMKNVAPNLAGLVGEFVGARLISHAGSLTNLAKFPASTIQILGAEKALFRALKTRGNTPKYGLLYHSTFIGRAKKENKGRISRYLANKCTIASRIDCFSDVPTDVFGQKLNQQVEDRLKFYETGKFPTKNVDVMTEALEEAEVAQAAYLKKKRKEEKKLKKQRQQELQSLTESLLNDTQDSNMNDEAVLNNTAGDEINESVKKEKKKKKRKSEAIEEANTTVNSVNEENHVEETFRPKKKKKLSVSFNADNELDGVAELFGEQVKTKKKKKKKNIPDI